MSFEEAKARGTQRAIDQRRAAIPILEAHIEDLRTRPAEKMYWTDKGRTFSHHPELALAEWGVENMRAAEQKEADERTDPASRGRRRAQAGRAQAQPRVRKSAP